MIIDEDTNAVIIPDKLQKNYQTFNNELSGILLNAGVLLKQVNNTADIWCRDFLPVQISEDKFVQFLYKPPYLNGHFHLCTDPEKLELPFKRSRSNLNIDGGNIVRWKNKVIVTDAIFSHNPGMSKSDVKNMLINQLAIEELIIIPRQPFDIFGHADGMVRFLDEDTVLVNNYVSESRHFTDKLSNTLTLHRLNIINFPYYYSARINSFGDYSAFGCYINYLQTSGTIVLPVFNHPNDDSAFKMMGELFPNHNIYPIRANDIAEQGGLLNCICWNYKY